jgi:hypothetical protein
LFNGQRSAHGQVRKALRDAWRCRAANIDKYANAGDTALRLNMEDDHGMIEGMFSLEGT